MTNKTIAARQADAVRNQLTDNWAVRENMHKPASTYISSIFDTLMKGITQNFKGGIISLTSYIPRESKSALIYNINQKTPTELEIVFTDNDPTDMGWHEMVRDGVRDLFLSAGFKVHIANVSKRQEEDQTDDFPRTRGPWNIGEVEEPPTLKYVVYTTLKILI